MATLQRQCRNGTCVRVAVLGGLTAAMLCAVLDRPAGAEGVPISHQWYRAAYNAGDTVRVTQDHYTHTPPNKIDMIGVPEGGYHRIRAAAPGIVRVAIDVNSECCSDTFTSGVSACAGCNNFVWIEHPNGEWTKYTHFMQDSVFVDSGDCVSAGTLLGIEGDVGHTSGGASWDRPADPCYDPSDTTVVVNGNQCGIHLHFEVLYDRLGPDPQLRIPLVCGSATGIYVRTDTLIAGSCGSFSCSADVALPAAALTGNLVRVVQASNTITGTGYEILDDASAAFIAGSSIHLGPGFRVERGAYFHGWIDDCNGQVSGCPSP